METDVIVVEDIIDSRLTLSYLKDLFGARRSRRSAPDSRRAGVHPREGLRRHHGGGGRRTVSTFRVAQETGDDGEETRSGARRSFEARGARIGKVGGSRRR